MSLPPPQATNTHQPAPLDACDSKETLERCISNDPALSVSASATSALSVSSTEETVDVLSSSSRSSSAPLTTEALLSQHAVSPTARIRYRFLGCDKSSASNETSGPGVLNAYFLDFPGYRTIVHVTQPDDARCFPLLLIADNLEGEHEDIVRGCLYIAGDASAVAMARHYGIAVDHSYYWDRVLNKWCARVLCRGQPGVFEIAGVKMQGPAPGDPFNVSVGGVPWRRDSDRRAVFMEQRRISLALYESTWHNDGTLNVHLPEAENTNQQ